jgi:uncharacterized protein YijF (DUF1287 family)
MKLEVPFKDIHLFLSNNYHIAVDIKNITKDKIKVTYFVSLILTIKKVTADEVVFQYESNVFVNAAVKLVHSVMRKKLEHLPLVWNSKTREIIIDLKKIKELDEFLKQSSISELSFIHETILLEVVIKPEK